MRTLWLMLAVLVCTSAPLVGHADEGSYKAARGVGYAGVVAAGVGPAMTMGGGALFAENLGPPDGEPTVGEGRQSTAGFVLLLAGVGSTALAPGVVVGSSLAGRASVNDMGAQPPITAGLVGLAGVGVQLTGIALSFGAVDPLAATGVRVAGWGTALVGGGVQMVNNAKHYREAAGLARRPRGGPSIALVPVGRGVGLVGSF